MSSRATDYLNSLLRGELAAAETYRKALAKVNGDAGAAELRQICSDHQNAAEALRRSLEPRNVQRGLGSRRWGVFAQAVEDTNRLLQDAAALAALKQGEECGAEDYEDALDDDRLPAECAGLIRTKLLPQARARIPVLSRLMEGQAQPPESDLN